MGVFMCVCVRACACGWRRCVVVCTFSPAQCRKTKQMNINIGMDENPTERRCEREEENKKKEAAQRRQDRCEEEGTDLEHRKRRRKIKKRIVGSIYCLL